MFGIRWFALFVALCFGLGASSTAFAEDEQPEEPSTGSITVVLDTAPETPDVDFDFSIRDLDDVMAGFSVIEFSLEDEGTQNSRTFGELAEGRYRVTGLGMAGWQIVKAECVGASAVVYSGAAGGIATVTLAEREDVVCSYLYQRVPATPTPEPTQTPAATSTPAPTATVQTVFVPVPVVQTVEVERIVEVEVPVLITPPATGDGGLR